MCSSVVDIIIPVYNEEQNLPQFYEQLTALPLSFHPIFIDNASTDGSLKFIESIAGATVIRHDRNMGYGASLRAGLQRATADKVIIIDADGEYSPQAIPLIVQELDHFEVVHTSRFLDRHNADIRPLKVLGNLIVTRTFNFLFRQQLSDLYTGCKGYRRERIARLQLHQNGFEHVLEITAKLARTPVAIKEIPIDYVQRKYGRSKMNHFAETLKYAVLVVYYSFAVTRKRSNPRP